ncbi:histamine H2 receptor-like [Xenia sp. Carnegie-2017]|uniref:histamine H2 receptor-like n=1 Tax=Xenia sp. Carnegie-2017 TaxID=2897299 RepID=UPI001F03A24F|nr:histamine H2 receptor-like [Xenia sp. Carnegie-2017]
MSPYEPLTGESGSGSGDGSGSYDGSGSGEYSGSGDWDDAPLYPRSFMIFLCIVAGIIVVVNSFIVVLVWRNRKLRNTCNALLVSLAIADGTAGFIGIPMFILTHFSLDRVSDHQFCFLLLGQFTWTWFLSFVSICHLLVIACEQYLAILKPFSHDKIVTKKTTALTIAVIWFFGVIHSLVPWSWIFTLGGGFCNEEEDPSPAVERNDKIYVSFSIIAFFILPIVGLYYVYYRIVSEAKRQLGRIRRDSVCSRGKYPNLSSCTRYRGFYIIAFMLIIFILCWAPYFSYVFYETFVGSMDNDSLDFILQLLRYLPSILNPIMFAFWRSDFRATCIERVCCCVQIKYQSRSSFTSGRNHIQLVNRDNTLSDSKESKPLKI